MVRSDAALYPPEEKDEEARRLLWERRHARSASVDACVDAATDLGDVDALGAKIKALGIA